MYCLQHFLSPSFKMDACHCRKLGNKYRKVCYNFPTERKENDISHFLNFLYHISSDCKLLLTKKSVKSTRTRIRSPSTSTELYDHLRDYSLKKIMANPAVNSGWFSLSTCSFCYEEAPGEHSPSSTICWALLQVSRRDTYKVLQLLGTLLRRS